MPLRAPAWGLAWGVLGGGHHVSQAQGAWPRCRVLCPPLCLAGQKYPASGGAGTPAAEILGAATFPSIRQLCACLGEVGTGQGDPSALRSPSAISNAGPLSTLNLGGL